MLKNGNFVHYSVFHLILNLWTYWACIKTGKHYDRLSGCIEWNLFYVKRRCPDHYLPFDIIYEEIKKNKMNLFILVILYLEMKKNIVIFLQSLNY